MSESMRMWVEIIFNLGYLVAIYWLVWLMSKKQSSLSAQRRQQTRPFIWAFFLLALGDTGHVGFRVLAYALGGLEKSVTVFGREVGLVGAGALSTAITVTFFYILILVVWSRRFEKPLGWFGIVLIVAGVARLVYMMLPVNSWNSIVPPQPYSLYRNSFLVIQGLGVAALIFRDSIAQNDRTFLWIGVCILLSYAFYIPVILFVQTVPVIGMLMIPKTLAYVAIAVIGNIYLFKPEE
ncbi:MAG: hypothetical protein P8Y72_12015 [Anaerolineales bacterium]|jgi:hypothetical protein